jgi:hypothetical protein
VARFSAAVDTKTVGWIASLIMHNYDVFSVVLGMPTPPTVDMGPGLFQSVLCCRITKRKLHISSTC